MDAAGTSPTSRESAFAGMVVALAVVGGAAAWQSEETTAPVWLVAAATVVPACVLVGAAFLWSAGPGSRVRVLMTCLAGAWVLGVVPLPAGVVGDVLGNTVGALWPAVLVQLVLSLPDGRGSGPAGRVLVVGAYAVTVPGNLLTYLDTAGSATALSAVVGVSQVAFGIVLLVVLAVRLVRMHPVQRRTLGPVLLAGGSVVLALLGSRLLGAVRVGGLPPGDVPGGWTVVVYGCALALLPLGVGVATATERLDRGRVADLATALARPTTSEQLRAAIAAALQDPTVQIVHRSLPSRGSPAESPYPSGRPHSLSPDRQVTVAVERDGVAEVELVHAPGPPGRARLVQAVAATARLALENDQLRTDLAARLEEVRASRARLLTASDTERRRLERNLHDGAQQGLVNVTVLLTLARRQVPDAHADAHATLDAATRELQGALGELRELAQGIHPAILSSAGLNPALHALAERAPIPVSVQVPPGLQPGPLHSETVYFVVSEALTNVTKHASAHRVVVRMDVSDDETSLLLEVRDDGIGGARPPYGSGLQGMSDRVSALGGTLQVDSPTGGGTLIRAVLPCAS